MTSIEQTEAIKEELEKQGFKSHSEEYLYDGITGEKVKTEIMTGRISYVYLPYVSETKIDTSKIKWKGDIKIKGLQLERKKSIPFYEKIEQEDGTYKYEQITNMSSEEMAKLIRKKE
jgi:hypothetical protein